MNLRNRIEGIDNTDAGNYEFVLLFDEEHYQTPEDIRRTLSRKGRFEANNGVMPGIWEALNCNLTPMTNAASFVEDYRLGDLRQILHVPIFDPKTIPMDMAVIYKAKEGRRAILYFEKKTFLEDYLAECELGETVSESLFPD